MSGLMRWACCDQLRYDVHSLLVSLFRQQRSMVHAWNYIVRLSSTPTSILPHGTFMNFVRLVTLSEVVVQHGHLPSSAIWFCLNIPGWSFRSGDNLQLARPRIRAKAGDAAFSVTAADLSNGPAYHHRGNSRRGQFYSGSKDPFF